MRTEKIISKHFFNIGGDATSSDSQYTGKKERILIKTIRSGDVRGTYGALNKRLRGDVFARGNSTGTDKSSTD